MIPRPSQRVSTCSHLSVKHGNEYQHSRSPCGSSYMEGDRSYSMTVVASPERFWVRAVRTSVLIDRIDDPSRAVVRVTGRTPALARISCISASKMMSADVGHAERLGLPA